MADLDALHQDIGDEIEQAVLRVVRSGRHVGGPEVEAFEASFGAYLGTAHAIAVGNGTDALQLALLACGVERGDEVLVPANSFVASAEAVMAMGAIPRFVDVGADSGLIDLDSAAQCLTERTRAVMPVHLYGRMVDMGPVMAFARDRDLVVIEDAAQAHGASREGRCAGTVGDAGCFSFYPGKNLGAIGDAGAVVTGDSELAERIRLLRDHGRRSRDDHRIAGFNSRMDPIQAATLTAKLAHLERWTWSRREIATRYRASLEAFLDWQGCETQAEVHHVFPILVEDREQLAGSLRESGIATGVHYRQAIPGTAAFAWSSDRCPVARERARTQLSLPIHPYLTRSEVERIADAVVSSRRRGLARRS